MRSTRYLKACFVLAASVLAEIAQPQAPLPMAQARQRVMAAAVTSCPHEPFSGLFLTGPFGWILYRRSLRDEPERIEFDQFDKYCHCFQEPRGIVFADPRLYVYDGAQKMVYSLLLCGDSKREPKPELISRLPDHPTHIAVSPNGLVAVIVGGEVVFLQQEARPVHYMRSRFRAPIDLAFSAWNKLQVLDGSRNALVSITFSQLDDGRITFEEENELTVPQGDTGQTWQAMTTYEGLVYLADQKTIYAYLASDNRLVPVATRSDSDHPIQELALTHESLYLLQSDHIHRYPRTQPVDVLFEGGPLDSQRALLALYVFLSGRKLLPTRSIVAQRAYESLEELLFDNKVLLVPREASAVQFERSVGAHRSVGRGSAEASEFMTLLCKLNAGVCPTLLTADAEPPSLTMPVAQGTRLEVPWLQMISRLSRDEIFLNGQTLVVHADSRVPSRELREKANTSLLLRLNPEWTEQDLSERKRGPAVVPAEKWTAVAAVPVPDFENNASELWSLTRQYAGVRLYSRQAFTRQSAKSLLLQPALSSAATDACKTLQKERDRLLAAIHYPAWFSALSQKELRVGVLEFASTVKKGHQVFWLEPAVPTWYAAKDLDLEPDRPLQNLVPRDVTLVSVFSAQADHGTHVAAIIGGRKSECWSGLLPHARLVLVDLTDTNGVSLSIDDTVNADARVFNVSNAFLGVEASPVFREIQNVSERAVFVVAAGNRIQGDLGPNLNKLDSVDAPIRWGRRGNVISVSGTDWENRPREDLFYYGKRYVDLLAPGLDIYSASEAPASYGPATGTSFATPLVTAAAAILVDLDRMSPADTKARLIATADWEDTGYEDLVWGGRLNFEAAVRFPQRNFLVTKTGQDLRETYSIEPANNPWVKITNAPQYYERGGSSSTALARVRFEWILSLRQHADGTFRVVFKEPKTDHLKIILHASLTSTDRIRCEAFELFDRENGSFTPSDKCDSSLDIDQIVEYVRGGTYNILWPEE